MSTPEIDRIAVTTGVDNYIDSLRQDETVVRRFSAGVASRCPTCAPSTGWRTTSRSRAAGRGRAACSTSA